MAAPGFFDPVYHLGYSDDLLRGCILTELAGEALCGVFHRGVKTGSRGNPRSLFFSSHLGPRARHAGPSLDPRLPEASA
jgi:hypothetical protein